MSGYVIAFGVAALAAAAAFAILYAIHYFISSREDDRIVSGESDATSAPVNEQEETREKSRHPIHA